MQGINVQSPSHTTATLFHRDPRATVPLPSSRRRRRISNVGRIVVRRRRVGRVDLGDNVRKRVRQVQFFDTRRDVEVLSELNLAVSVHVNLAQNVQDGVLSMSSVDEQTVAVQSKAEPALTLGTS